MPTSLVPALLPARSRVPALPPARRRQPDLFQLRTGERLAAIVALLSRNHLFRACSRNQLDYLAATSWPASFETGDSLCVEGTFAPACYVVSEGRAVVTIGHRGVGAVAANDVVGERGVLFDTVRAATVTATLRTVTCAIARERLQELVEDSRRLRNWMLEDVRRHYPGLG